MGYRDVPFEVWLNFVSGSENEPTEKENKEVKGYTGPSLICHNKRCKLYSYDRLDKPCITCCFVMVKIKGKKYVNNAVEEAKKQ